MSPLSKGKMLWKTYNKASHEELKGQRYTSELCRDNIHLIIYPHSHFPFFFFLSFYQVLISGSVFEHAVSAFLFWIEWDSLSSSFPSNPHTISNQHCLRDFLFLWVLMCLKYPTLIILFFLKRAVCLCVYVLSIFLAGRCISQEQKQLLFSSICNP